MKFKVVVVLFLLSSPFMKAIAQEGKECVNEIIKLEEKFNAKDYNGDKPIHLSYYVRTTDWDGQTVVSNVDVYRDQYKMHFFSDQANIYQDEKDVYIVLKAQKMIVINSTKKELNSKRESSDFADLRKEFLTNCEVVKCTSSKNDSLKVLELKVNDDMGGAIKINRIIYEYNAKTEKIISTKVYYNEDYKVKEIAINYKELDMDSDYKFYNARKHIIDNNNKLLAKYKGYELVDNREK